MDKWEEVKLGDVCKFFNGKSIKPNKRKIGFPIYGSNGIIGFSNENKYENKIILGRVGAYCGSVNYENKKFWASDNTIVLDILENNDIKFFYYMLKIMNLNNYAGGSAQPLINQTILKKLQIKLPPLETQKKIAQILSNYDELIENNNKRIEILEQQAKTIYDEWFVKFKFIGYEKVEFVDSELGKIPRGWEVKKIGDKIAIKKGKNITKKQSIPGNVPVASAGIKPNGFHNESNTKYPVFTISASGANAGVVILHNQDVWASDCSYIDSSITKFVFFYYSLMINRQIEITLLQRGSAQPHVYPKDLMELKFICPTENLIKEFEELGILIFNQIKNLNNKNQNLRKTRDLLLPRLISGELDTKDLNINLNKIK